MSEEPVTSEALIGTVIGGYHVMQAIGRGGMGTVYRAVEPTIDAEVAIKVLGTELAREPEAVERFISEAKTANLVRHEGLVKVIGLGVLADGRPYQIMEHLTGLPLSSVIQHELPLGTLCTRLAEALRAIGAMHDRGIIHRDLKPSNLFVTSAGYIKVLDFGIAKLADAVGITRTGHTIGTPEYMSPEQAEALPLDPRSDLYAMGIVLYECVVGVRPFEGRVVEAIVNREPPPHLEPAALDDIIQTAMAAAPSDRFATAEMMAQALDRAAVDLPTGSLLADATPRLLPVAATTVVAKPKTERLGRYAVLGTVGRGGQGTVLLGHDPEIDRKVALKLVADADRDRVVIEARAMAKINHPNVVTLFELGEADGQVFLVMEYFDAIDLETWLQEPRDHDELVARFVAAGRGLAAAHAVGIVHRDFKPANVFVTRDGVTKVGDFGIARLGGASDTARGTVGYMAPEQIEGGPVDPRADQFAFAAALWHALHGELPFVATTAVGYALAVHRGELRTPSHRTALDATLRRALSARAEDRFESIDVLLDRLVARPARRRPAVAAIGLALVAGFGVTYALAHRNRPLSLTEIAKLPTGSDQLRALAKLPEPTRDGDAARALAGTAALDGYVRSMSLPQAPRGPIAISETSVAVLLDHSIWVLGHEIAAPLGVTALYLDDARHTLRAATADGVVETGLQDDTWKPVLTCMPRAPGTFSHDRALRVVGCEQTDGIHVHTLDDSRPWQPDLEGKTEISANAGRLYAVTLDRTTISTVALTGDHAVAHHALPAGAQLLFGDDQLGIVTAHGVSVWDPVHDREMSWTDDGEAIVAATMVSNRIVVTSATRATVLTIENELTVTTIVQDPPQRIVEAGARLVELYADHVTVDAPEQLASWSLAGAPGMVAASPRGDRIALVDDRVLRIWEVSLREPVALPARQVMRSNLLEPWFVTRTADELRWYAVGLEPHLVATTPWSNANLISSAVPQTTLFSDPSGTWRWQPPKPPERITAQTGFARVYELAGVLVGVKGDQLVELVSGATRCDGGRIAAASRRGLAVVGDPARVCNIVTGEQRPLEGSQGARWQFNADGSLVTALGPHARLFDSQTASYVASAGLAAIEAPSKVEGTRDMLYVEANGIVVVTPAGTTQLAPPTRLRSAEYSGARVFTVDNNQITAIDVPTGSRRILGHTSLVAVLPMIYAYDHEIGIYPRDGAAIAMWSTDPPTVEQTERWLSLAR